MLELFGNSDTNPFTCCFFFIVFFFSFKVHHLNNSVYIWNCCSNEAQLFKQKNNNEGSCDWNFSMSFLTTLSSKNIIANLRIVTIEISELTFLIILYFNAHTHQYTSIYTVQPWFFEHQIIWFPQIFESFR